MQYMLSRLCFTLSSVILFVGFTFSQGIAIGQWREHLPYNYVVSVADAVDKIYAATPYALFSYDKDDYSLERYSKVSVLSDVGLSSVEWHSQMNTLIIGYTNGNLDMLQGNTVQNISDIKRSSILGSKKINRISIRGDNVYLCCDFGIVLFDFQKMEIKDTYFIGPNGAQIPVFDIAFLNDSIYAATGNGIYSADINNPNLPNFNNWYLDSSLIRTGFDFNLIHNFQGKLIVNITQNLWDSDTSFVKITGGWEALPQLSATNKYRFRSYGNSFIVAQTASIMIMDQDLNQENVLWSFDDNFIYPNDVVRDSEDENVFWIGDRSLGLIRNSNIWSNEYIYPSGPFTPDVYNLVSAQGKVIGVPGARNISWNNAFKRLGYFAFENESWVNKNNLTTAGFDTLWDALSVAFDPQNPSRWFIGSFGKGIAEIHNHELVNVYNANNTTMSGTVGWPGTVHVSGLKFDNQNNLWVTTSYTNQCISVKTWDNTWYSYDLPVVSSTDIYSDIVIDRWGTKWIIMPKGGGMVVFNENGTFDNRTDDQYLRLTNSIGKGNLPSMNVYSIAEDKDGRIWIGTDKGIAVFYYPQNIFTGQNFDAQQILVEVGGYVQPLMESEVVNCIVVDGANRKWIGTDKGGVFLLSPDGTEEIYHFTTENSPILSNSIGSIAITPETGEVFFGTYEGLISFKSTATEAPPAYTDSVLVYAYPNPVKPDYTGTIAVKNLVYNSWVKITDIYGNLIFETRALGGQAVWDGKMPDGTKPRSGVFLVFATDNDGTETLVTKILFIN